MAIERDSKNSKESTVKQHKLLLLVTLCLVTLQWLNGCASAPTTDHRYTRATEWIADAGWQPWHITTTGFDFFSAGATPSTASTTTTSTATTPTLTVYIEGDGRAWADKHTPSFDPTPNRPVALQLALQDSHGVYLARPCQFATGTHWRNCNNRYWTSHRFSAEVIAATNEAISQLKQRYGSSTLRLVGYSGGGAVAALVAARRDDVEHLTTVAGNVDIVTWATGKQLSPLGGSLNPAEAWQQLVDIPQVHFVGGADTVVEPAVAHAFRQRFPSHREPRVIIIPRFSHHCCWVAQWPTLLKQQLQPVPAAPQLSPQLPTQLPPQLPSHLTPRLHPRPTQPLALPLR